jgi:hypothetical protein
MFDKLTRARDLLKEFAAEFDPDVLGGKSALTVVEISAEAERVAAGCKTLAAKRAADSGAWRKSGAKSPAHWMATTTGTSVGAAVGVLETAARLSELPATEKAVRKGRLSEAQTKEIASAAAANPAAEKDLLGVAQSEGMATLRQRCARVKAAVASEIDRYNKIHRSRYLRHWMDAQGGFRLEGRFTPDAGAQVVAALDPYRDKVFKQARKHGRREPYDAYAADALVAMAKDAGAGGNKKGPGTLVRVLVDHQAFKRGHTQNGEVCEIEGIGPIPVATAQALAQDAVLAALTTDGTDVYTVTHMGRQVTARQRTALEIRDRTCVVGGCDVRDYLEIDHVTGFVITTRTELKDLARLCPHHHYLKTYKGWVLSGGPRKWRLEPPGESGPDPPTR